MLSTLFPPDPTLTVDNVGHVMEKVKPKVKTQVWVNACGVMIKNEVEELGRRMNVPTYMSTAAHILHGSILPSHYTVITRWLQLRK